MTLNPGGKLAHYRLVEKIGEGGMGVVWKAVDTSLDREVAIKVLPDGFDDQPERLARFEREAKLLASLNHPGIAAVYGLHEAEGVRFIAMELVRGEDLAQRLQRGPLALDDALDVALKVARALEAAHGSGVIHRDLKPANILRVPDGKVKVLDFGLAKALVAEPLPDAAAAATRRSMSPTITSAGTVAGVVLGTASYMSPEQAKGRPVDRRADNWAFGCVLFEMLAGKRPFSGGTISETLAEVLKSEPDWSALPSGTPRGIRRLLRRCLAKDPDIRLHDIADARLEIDDALREPAEREEPGAAPAPPAHTTLARLLPWAVTLLAMAVAGWFALVAPERESSNPPLQVVSSILPPPDMGFDLDHGLAISPDGTRVAFVARDAEGLGRLWVRSLARATARLLDGTEGARAPFWSPDGRYLGFFAQDRLKKLDLGTGVVESLSGLSGMGGSVLGATWGSAGDIVFVQDRGAPLMRIPASGGQPEPVTVIENEGPDVHSWPSFLPDGRHFLYLVRRYGSDEAMGQLRVGTVDGSPSTLLFPSNSAARYVPPGYLVWWQQGNLRAQRFDLASRSLQGEPVALIADVRFDPRIASAAFSISNTGVLVYQQGGALSGNQLVWLDRRGNELGTIGPAGSLYDPELSPDGSRIAVDISGETNQGDIWIIDVRRGTSTRLTSAQEDETSPVWSPDGDTLAYCSASGVERFAVFTRPARGSGEARILVQDPQSDLDPVAWHGDFLLLNGFLRLSGDLLSFSIKDQETRPYLATPFDERSPDFSPDGRHVAYVSDETGRMEVYVQTFPEPGESWRISADGGGMPRWSPDGSELFFVSPRKELMTVAVSQPEGARGPEFGAPRSLFRVDVKESPNIQWDLIDGERFLFNRNIRAGADDPLTLVQNWHAALER